MRFFAGLVIGLLIGTGGTLAVSSQDLIGAGKATWDFTTKASEIISQHVDENTAELIMTEINKEYKKGSDNNGDN